MTAGSRWEGVGLVAAAAVAAVVGLVVVEDWLIG